MTLRGRCGALLAALLLAIGGPALANAAAVGPPILSAAATDAAAVQADDEIVVRIRAAVVERDLDYFEKRLVDWDGARKRTQRLTLFQIRECFGRPIKSVALEPLKPDPDVPLVPDGYRTNLPVTHLLHIVFEEQHAPDETPSCVFMLSKDPSATYRMALVLSKDAPSK